MRVPINWLKEYVDLEISSQELAEKLTRAGVEVEGISHLVSGLDGVLVGEIIAFEKHPDSEKLWVVQVNIGKERLQVVAGIKNYQCGDKVPVALPGAKLVGGEIASKPVRGIASQGMLCAAVELGLDLQVEYGILILDKDTPVGTSIVTAFNLDEDILELELTPNRADCLGLLGVAREVSALTGGKIKLPEVLSAGEEPLSEERVKITIEDSNLCPRYTARIAEKVVIGPSPLAFQLRLLKAGIRPINNVVDISNYVMWETGQPLHTFDFSGITGGEIIVRRAARGEGIVTLDNQIRELHEDILVIADCHKPVGIAGVMGGLNSEITAVTEAVLIESAHFNPVSIRRTSRTLGLVSEASQRFEKGTDIGGTLFAADRAALLMKQLCGCNVLPGAADNYPVPYKKKIISLRPERARDVLGLDLPAAKMKEILSQLGLDIREEAGSLYVDVPSRRRDIDGEIDLIEEVGRVYGYDFLEATLPWGIMTQGQKSLAQKNINTIQRFLTAQGFFEIITFSFLRKKALLDLMLQEEDPLLKAIPLENPLSEEQGVLRTTILPNMLDTVKYNLNRGQAAQFLFEIGNVFRTGFLPLQKQPEEIPVISLIAMDGRGKEHWRQENNKLDFYWLKGLIEGVLAVSGRKDVSFKPCTRPYIHPYEGSEIRLNNEHLGVIGALHPELLERNAIEAKVYFAEIELPLLIETNRKYEFKPLPRFPAVLRDLAVIVGDDAPAARVEEVIKTAGGSILEEIRLFDVYKGDQVAAGQKSLAYKLVFRDAASTLKDEEVNRVMLKIIDSLGRELKASLRS